MSWNYKRRSTYQALRQMSRLIGQTFYEKGEGQFEGMIRTYYMAFNSFANKITPQVLNWHHAEIIPEMKPYHPRIITTVMTAQPHSPEFY